MLELENLYLKRIKILKRGDIEFKKGNYNLALDYYIKLLEKDSDCVSVWDKIRLICEEKGMIEHAIDAYKQMYRIDSKIQLPRSWILDHKMYNQMHNIAIVDPIDRFGFDSSMINTDDNLRFFLYKQAEQAGTELDLYMIDLRIKIDNHMFN